MGAWPLASCQEQQQSCHGQKDTREALAQAEEGWEGETGPPGRRSCQPAPSPPPRLGLGQVTPPLGKNQQSCWLEDEIPTESPHSPAGGGGCRGWRLDPQEPLGWDGGGRVHWGAPPARGAPSMRTRRLGNDLGTQGWHRAPGWGRKARTQATAAAAQDGPPRPAAPGQGPWRSGSGSAPGPSSTSAWTHEYLLRSQERRMPTGKGWAGQPTLGLWDVGVCMCLGPRGRH